MQTSLCYQHFPEEIKHSPIPATMKKITSLPAKTSTGHMVHAQLDSMIFKVSSNLNISMILSCKTPKDLLVLLNFWIDAYLWFSVCYHVYYN